MKFIFVAFIDKETKRDVDKTSLNIFDCPSAFSTRGITEGHYITNHKFNL